MEALTPKQIQDAFTRHIRPAGLTYVKAGDFAGARAKAAAPKAGAPEGEKKAEAK
ncbi:MAG: hypothetical protein AAB359_04130 [Elusimicrobiota bacterium]